MRLGEEFRFGFFLRFSKNIGLLIFLFAKYVKINGVFENKYINIKNGNISTAFLFLLP